jgi:hypothetical protein
MKTIVNWVVIGVFALQATGVVWFTHLAECCEPARTAFCPCGHCDDAGDHGLAWGDLAVFQRHPVSPAKPTAPRHDPGKCGICQSLVMLSATTEIPPALPAIQAVAFEQPVPSPRLAAHTSLSTLDARGPPVFTL